MQRCPNETIAAGHKLLCAGHDCGYAAGEDACMGFASSGMGGGSPRA